jgi:hypothetical protein
MHAINKVTIDGHPTRVQATVNEWVVLGLYVGAHRGRGLTTTHVVDHVWAINDERLQTGRIEQRLNTRFRRGMGAEKT